MYYNHSLGMQYSKITEQIYVGSCLQSEDDIDALKDNVVSEASCLLRVAAENNELLMRQLEESRERIERLEEEAKGVNIMVMEDQIEHQKSVNEDLSLRFLRFYIIQRLEQRSVFFW